MPAYPTGPLGCKIQLPQSRPATAALIWGFQGVSTPWFHTQNFPIEKSCPTGASQREAVEIDEVSVAIHPKFTSLQDEKLEIHRSPEGIFWLKYLQHPVDGILKDAIALHIKGHPPYFGSGG